MEILKTENEKKREARHAEIIKKYTRFRKASKASNNRIFTTIANDYQMTVAGVRKIVVANNALQK